MIDIEEYLYFIESTNNGDMICENICLALEKLKAEYYKEANIEDDVRIIRKDIYGKNVKMAIYNAIKTLSEDKRSLIPITMRSGSDRGMYWTVDDQKITLSGRNPYAEVYILTVGTGYIDKGVNVIVSGCPKGGSIEGYSLQLRDDTDWNVGVYARDYGDAEEIVIPAAQSYALCIRIASAYAFENDVIFVPKVMTANSIINVDPELFAIKYFNHGSSIKGSIYNALRKLAEIIS